MCICLAELGSTLLTGFLVPLDLGNEEKEFNLTNPFQITDICLGRLKMLKGAHGVILGGVLLWHRS